jgi:polyphenol oxidase
MWTLDPRSPVPAWRLEGASGAATLAFSTRLGGVSRPPFDTLNLGRSTEDDPDHVAENRHRFAESLGLLPAAFATAGQVHGTDVALATAPGLYHRCDALVTRTPDLPLAITGADCTPLLLEAPGVVAAVHSGWRGTAAGVAVKALHVLCAEGDTDASTVTVHVGPSIRSCCYRVGDEVARQFPAETVRFEGEGWHLDLVAAARLQLGAAGVDAERIHEVPGCTACEPAYYFSHRRDGPRTGRHWAVAALHAKR